MKYLLVVTMALVLGACGSKADDEAALATSATGSRPAASGSDSVAAVQDSPGTPVAQLRFVIDTRPVVGKPFRLQLIASALAPVAQLQVAAESDVLRIESGNAVLALELDASGSGAARVYSATHDLSVTADQAGLAEVAVHLTAEPDSPEALYLIPVLVAKAESAAATPASDKADPATEADHAQPQNR